MKIIGAIFKTATLAFLVIALSQIPVNNKRICDHVYDVIHAESVQKMTRWVSRTFDFKDPHSFTTRFKVHNDRTSQNEFSSELKTLKQSGIDKSSLEELNESNELKIEKIDSDKINKSDREELESLLHSK